ncbi:helix-turn-helix domain-containing protein [Lentibacillus saliphilus]|uniref:helix-turn-helix domain-containing protein n=1 Tax=Lentibacillus saliphilus TaxID=2737028 RepID=UPI001C303DA8|nr:helix-turn-helix domain-containing protein [Lentibacillus saliphilus]
MGIGTRLKEAREAKDISLDELQETTKIQKRYLHAIEEENYQILPGTFYARAFIKEYAVSVGLNADELLAEYENDLPKLQEDDAPQYTRIQRSRKSTVPAKNSAVFSIIPRIIVVILVLGIVFAAWYFIKENLTDEAPENAIEEPGDNEVIRNPGSNDGASNDGTSNTDDNAEEENDTEDNADTTEEPAEPELELELIDNQTTGNSATAVYELKHAGDAILATLETDVKTWLTVTDTDEEMLYYDFFEAEQSPLEIDFSGENEVYLKIGNASGISIKINGVELDLPNDPKQYVVQNITINIK